MPFLFVCICCKTYLIMSLANQTPSIKPKKGAVILIGGGDGNREDAYKTVCTILHHINVSEVYPLVGSFNTNKLSAIKDNNAIKEITDIANYLNN